MKVPNGSHERAMLAWRIHEYGPASRCGSATGAKQLTFIYSDVTDRRHVCFLIQFMENQKEFLYVIHNQIIVCV